MRSGNVTLVSPNKHLSTSGTVRDGFAAAAAAKVAPLGLLSD